MSVVKGPDGKMRTVADRAPIDLERARRETRDVIQGNVPFHDDPFTPRPQPELGEGVTVSLSCMCAYLGGECEVCRDA